MPEDHQLLHDYAHGCSESAFTELVQRHVDLVYSAALRETHGDSATAEEITQEVFTELARKSSNLCSHPALAGWLYTCVRRMSANARRSNDRRQRREVEAHNMNELLSSDSTESSWRQVEPVLDDAMHELSETDRAAVVLRFFEDRSHKEVGLALGLSESAARKRVDRALESLRGLLARRGVTIGASGLVVVISANAVQAAPVGLAVTISTAVALAGTTVATAATAAATKTIAMTTLQKALVTTTVAVLAGAGIFEARQVSQLRDQVQTLQQQQAPLAQQIQQLELERDDSAQQIAALRNENQRLNNNTAELLKLRGTVGVLKRQLAERAKAPAKVAATSEDAGTTFTPEEELKQAAIAKMNYAKEWLLAFHLYANQNQGHFPTNFDQAATLLDQATTLLRDEAKLEANLKEHEFLPNTPQYGFTPDQYEIMYQGAITELTNAQEIIVIREKEPWQAEDGSWVRAYGFADGHAEIHKAADGNFETWEAKHMIPRPAPKQ